MTPLPNFDIASIATVEDGLAHIRSCIAALKNASTKADFSDEETVDVFRANMDFLKQCYSRVGSLIHAGSAP